jgi:hypothetical protein
LIETVKSDIARHLRLSHEVMIPVMEKAGGEKSFDSGFDVNVSAYNDWKCIRKFNKIFQKYINFLFDE